MYELEYHCKLTMTGVISAKTCLHVLMTLLTLLVAEQGAGLRLTFPDINDDVITAAENSQIHIRFGVADLDGVTDHVLINLDIGNDTSTETQFLCVIIYDTSSMSYTVDEKMNCSVPPGGDTVVFTKTVSRQDDKATLTWTLTQHDVKESLRLNVTYPPTITSLTFENDSNETTKTMKSGEKLGLNCAWNNGNPPTAVSLLNNKGQLLTENSNTFLTFELNPVTCNLTGVFTCQAAGAEVNRSVTLLVQCPPEFSATEDLKKSFIAGQPVTLIFHVVSHTRDIRQCRLRQLSSDIHPAYDVYRLNSTFNCFVTGQPPDLNLTVVMLNVSDTEEGDWHLELSNDGGNTSTKFSLMLNPYSDDESSSPLADKVYIMVAVGCGFLLLCVAIIVVFLLRRAKHTADTTLRHNVGINNKKTLKPVLSEDMIINEVYESAEDYPMSYTALGNESTALPGNSEGEYVYADTAKIVTWKEQNTSNTAAGNSGEGDNLYAQVQKGDRNTPSSQGDSLYTKVQKGDRNIPSSQGDSLYAKVQKGDKNTQFNKGDNTTAKNHLTDDTESAYMSVDVRGAVGKEAKGGDDHAS